MPQLPREHRQFGRDPGPARHLVPLALALAAGLLSAESGDQHHVTAVRFWSLGDVTRIAIETDGDFQVRSDHLSNPDRIFFDLAGTRPSMGKTLTVIHVGDKFVNQIRVAEPQHNVTRVVLDLAGLSETSTSRLENPPRLMIELRPAGRAPAESPEVARRRFSPPPAPAPAILKHTQDAVLDPPPVVDTPPSPVAAAITAKLSASTLRASAVPPLAKPSLPPAPMASLAPRPTAPANTVPAPSPDPPLLAKPSGPASPVASLAPKPTPMPSSAPQQETALPARRNSSGDRSMIRVLGLKIGTIVLDPGHGGHDTGTVGPEGLREKDLVLDVSRRLGALIEDRMGSEVIYTRTDDTFIPLERRTEIANEAKADLFLSIHANSSPLRTAAGVETYYLNFTTSKTALDVAARENSGSEATVYELQDLLQKIALKDKVDESREFATRIQTALFALSAKNNVHAKDRGVKKAPFVVLIGATMPSVLAEIGFISNVHDETVMKRNEYRDRIAEALYKGLSGYANTLSHFQVAQRH